MLTNTTAQRTATSLSGISRRDLLRRMCAGMGMAGLAGVLGARTAMADDVSPAGRTLRRARNGSFFSFSMAARRTSIRSIPNPRSRGRGPAAVRRALQKEQGQRVHAVAVRLRKARRERHRSERNAAASRASRSTIAASSARCTPTCRITSRRCFRCTPATSSRSGHRWARGCSTASAPKTKIFPATSCCGPARKSWSARRCGATASCPREYQATSVHHHRHGGGQAGRQHPQPASRPRRTARATRPAWPNSTARHLAQRDGDAALEGEIQRDGNRLPHAARGDGYVRHQPRAERPCASRMATRRSRARACWRAGCSKPACAS